MTLLALTAVICFGFAVYNLTCAFADIPTKRTSQLILPVVNISCDLIGYIFQSIIIFHL